MSRLKSPVLAVALVAPLACADDGQPVSPAEESSSTSGGDADADGTPPMDTSANDTMPNTTGSSTAAVTSTDGTDGTQTSGPTSDTDATSTTDAGDTTDGGSTDGGSTDTGSTDAGSTDAGSTDAGSTDAGSTDESSSEGSSTGELSELEKFESPQVFGDQVAETDLIGVWSLPTDGSMPDYTMKLTIEADGSFTWFEYSEFCEPSRAGSGWLWVSGPTLVMLWDTFTGVAPFDVQTKFGWTAEAPFLTRSGYVPALGHLAITFPDAMRIATRWGSRGYVRTVGGGTIEDTWVAETELWDVPPGADEASIVGRKRYTMDVGDDEAWETINHWWFEDGEQTADPTEYYLYTYTDELNGYGTINNLDYLYLGSAMMTYEPGENFLLDGPTPCDG